MAWSWYTKGRRIPTIIGKDVSGRRIPGGPYTGLQAVTAAAVPALLWWTRGLWAADMAGLAMFAVLVGVTVVAVKLVGKVDFASRNPLLLLAGYLRQTSRPAAGTLAGRKLTEPKPHRVAAPVGVAHLEPRAVHIEPRAVPAAALPIDDSELTNPQLGEPVEVETAEPVEQPLEQSATFAPAAVDGPGETAAGSPAISTLAAIPVGETTVPQPGTVAAALRPATAVAPDRRRTGLEAFLAGAAAARTTSTEEDAA
jgi:hypothetical protein